MPIKTHIVFDVAKSHILESSNKDKLAKMSSLAVRNQPRGIFNFKIKICLNFVKYAQICFLTPNKIQSIFAVARLLRHLP